VGLAVTVPFGNVRLGERVRPAGDSFSNESDPEDRSVSAGFNAIGADYFRALDIPLMRGRFFTQAETESDSAPPVAIVNEELARRLFPDEDPLGRSVRYGDADTEKGRRIFEIVGVVPTFQHNLIPARAEPYIFVPFGQDYRSNVHLHLSVLPAGDEAEAGLLQVVRQEISAANENMPILTSRTFHDHFDHSAELWLVRTGARLFSLFGALALFLAAAGVYGVRAYMVAQRTREIGIRMALGATRRDAVRLVLREGITLTSYGLGLGLALALMVGQLLSGMLYQVSATDPAVFVGAPLVLALVSILACYVPARRAATVDTMVALRYE
jgi:putative ABC transport system permease protein